MSATDGSTRRPDGFDLHQIRVQGHLDRRCADWLDGLTVRHEGDGATTLPGPRRSNRFVTIPSAIAEISMMAYLLVKGVRSTPIEAVDWSQMLTAPLDPGCFP